MSDNLSEINCNSSEYSDYKCLQLTQWHVQTDKLSTVNLYKPTYEMFNKCTLIPNTYTSNTYSKAKMRKRERKRIKRNVNVHGKLMHVTCY